METGYNELVIQLARGISQRRMYFSDHPKVRDNAQNFLRLLTRIVDEAPSHAFFLGVADGKLVHNGHYLVGPTIVGSRLADLAGELQCGGFLFRQGLGLPEVTAFLDLAVEKKASGLDLDGARALLAARGITHIELSPPYEDEQWYGQYHFDAEDSESGSLDADPELDQILPVFQSVFNTVETAHGKAGQGRELDISHAQTVAQSLVSNTSNLTDLMQMVSYPDFDSYTVGHSVRVAMLAVLVGKHLRLQPGALAELAVAGMLHDVGKAKIPEEILFKPGKLDPRERRVMETHTELGAEILLANGQASPLAVAVAWGHHRKPGGGGYPLSSVPAEAGPVTDLVHVCDVFEALTAVRPYKPALSARRTYEIMLQDVDAFSRPLLAAFIRAVGIYPPGSEVRLSNGQQAVVTSANPQPDRPRVRVTHNHRGLPLRRDQQSEIDLSRPEHGLSVECCLLAG